MIKKTYARAIDARSYIEARSDLACLTYVIDPVTVDGKRRHAPKFQIAKQSDADLVTSHGFAYEWAGNQGEENMAQPKAKTIDQKAMLANLTVKGWSGRASDASAADYVATGHQANVEWVKVSKRLVKAEALKAIRKAENDARATHRELTLPWHENGQRILPAAASHEYMKRMSDHATAHETAVDEFIAAYDELREEARGQLGGLFDASNYPDSADLMAKFVFDSELSALDVTGDFRVDMSDSDMKRLQAQITKRTEARLNAAMSDVYQRLAEVVGHMAQRLRDYKPKTEDEKVQNPFRDATLNNVRDMVDLLPKLNMTNDPALDNLATEIRQNLLEADAATLRTDDDKRAKVAEEADKIVGAMAGMM